MQFPFVSRETLKQETALRDQQIADLKAENKRLEAKVWHLSDQIVYRHSGRHMDPSLETKASVAEAPAKPEGLPEVPTAVQKAAMTGGSKVRAALQSISAGNMAEWHAEERRKAALNAPLTPMPTDPARDSAKIQEVVEKFASAIEEGRAAAN